MEENKIIRIKKKIENKIIGLNAKIIQNSRKDLTGRRGKKSYERQI